MNAKEAKEKTKENRLKLVKYKIELAVRNGQRCCVINPNFEEDVGEWLTSNGYKYRNGVVRW